MWALPPCIHPRQDWTGPLGAGGRRPPALLSAPVAAWARCSGPLVSRGHLQGGGHGLLRLSLRLRWTWFLTAGPRWPVPCWLLGGDCSEGCQEPARGSVSPAPAHGGRALPVQPSPVQGFTAHLGQHLLVGRSLRPHPGPVPGVGHLEPLCCAGRDPTVGRGVRSSPQTSSQGGSIHRTVVSPERKEG